MLVSSKKAKVEKEAAFNEGRNTYIEQLQAWHKRCADNQVNLDSSFDPTTVSKYSINVWDDYPEEEGTYAYVEMCEVPDRICFDVLLHLFVYAKSNPKIMDMGVNLGMRFCDSSECFPTLIGRRDGEYSLFKRWEIIITGADYEILEKVVGLLKEVPAFSGKSLDIYSES